VLAAALAASIALLVSRQIGHDRFEQKQAIEYDKNGAMTLADGSRVRLRENGRIRLEHFDERRAELTLEQGAAELDVIHVSSRMFVVHVGRFDVVDVGTRFVVTLDPQGIHVAVELGSVDVRDTMGVLPPRTISAGESWSSSNTAPIATPESTSESSDAGTAPALTTTTAVRSPSPKEMFEEAEAARVAGRPRDAAGLFDALRRHHRSDARAGLAAFQLGRLRLDSLGDAAGAVEAFDDAIGLAPAASFREDAEARRVEALDRTKDPRCREARETYLVRYPQGIHTQQVSARCASQRVTPFSDPAVP
jgi:hypothetical protein